MTLGGHTEGLDRPQVSRETYELLPPELKVFQQSEKVFMKVGQRSLPSQLALLPYTYILTADEALLPWY